MNALWHGTFSILFAPGEGLQPAAIKGLLEHVARTDVRFQQQRNCPKTDGCPLPRCAHPCAESWSKGS
jgi:hypothetical protein